LATLYQARQRTIAHGQSQCANGPPKRLFMFVEPPVKQLNSAPDVSRVTHHSLGFERRINA
jgi:hypothetical protein